MSSFFRHPDDVTDTDTQDETFDESGDDTNVSNHDNDGVDVHSEQLQGLQTVQSGESTSSVEGLSQNVSLINRTHSSEHVLRALLEEKCLTDALADFQNLNQGTQIYTKDHPEVVALADSKYQYMVDTLGQLNVLPRRPEQRDSNSHATRQQFRQGLEYLSSQSPQPGRPGLAHQEESLLGINSGMRELVLASSKQAVQRSTYDAVTRSTQSIADLPTLLQPLVDHPMFEVSRYLRDFEEIGMIGKGGYGKVYHVRHKLDGSNYAVKKINLNSQRIKRIQERGQAELDTLLNELRTLASFDHPNIVRYYGGWLEHSKLTVPTTRTSDSRLMIEAPLDSDQSISDVEFTGRLRGYLAAHTIPETTPTGVDIMFERSAGGILGDLDNMDEQDDLLAQLQPQVRAVRKRRASESTTASSKSKLSSVDSLGPDDDDLAIAELQAVVISDSGESGLMTASTFNDASHRAELESMLTLHIQMSLHPLSLAEFLSKISADTLEIPELRNTRHCFHIQMSLQVLLAILDGVDYLHDCGVVHRDLKPSNIFLAVKPSRSPACIDLSKCQDCLASVGSNRVGFLGLRIGDFGLVSEIARAGSQNSINTRVVGTELYRPVSANAVASEKLDVFALGIITTELLCPFVTRMERHQTLREVRNGSFDDRLFSTNFGPVRQKLAALIRGMTCSEEGERWSCSQVRREVEALLT